MVDYSRWKNIELSSDEDEVHPFIDNKTLFRLRHDARLKKMEKRKQEEFEFECRKASYLKRLADVQNVLECKNRQGTNMVDVQNKLTQLDNEKDLLRLQEKKLQSQKVNWYIDTICQPGFSKTSINNSVNKSSDVYVNFVNQHKTYLKQFASLKTFEETKNFLLLHQQIIKRYSLYFLISLGIKLYLKEEKDKLVVICRQIVILLHIFEIYKLFHKCTNELLTSFFTNINLSDTHCKAEFEKECTNVRKHIRNMVIEKLNKTKDDDKRDETTQSQSCDPEDVFNSLPEELKQCFIIRDKSALGTVLSNMPPESARYYMRRCIDSGLWIPQKNGDVN